MVRQVGRPACKPSHGSFLDSDLSALVNVEESMHPSPNGCRRRSDRLSPGASNDGFSEDALLVLIAELVLELEHERVCVFGSSGNTPSQLSNSGAISEHVERAERLGPDEGVRTLGGSGVCGRDGEELRDCLERICDDREGIRCAHNAAESGVEDRDAVPDLDVESQLSDELDVERAAFADGIIALEERTDRAGDSSALSSTELGPIGGGAEVQGEAEIEESVG